MIFTLLCMVTKVLKNQFLMNQINKQLKKYNLLIF